MLLNCCEVMGINGPLLLLTVCIFLPDAWSCLVLSSVNWCVVSCEDFLWLSLSLSAFCQPAQRSRRTKPSKFKAIQSSWSNGNVLDILFDFNPKPQGPQKVVSANECNCFMIFMLRATRNPCTVDRLYILTISVQWKIDAGPSDAQKHHGYTYNIQ